MDAHVLHTTGFQHIDALALCPDGELVALATSSLTGDVWDGALTMVSLQGNGAAAAREEVNIGRDAGTGALAWPTPDTLLTGDDQGDVTLWQRQGQGTTFKDMVTFGEHSQPVTAVAGCATAPTRVASTSLDGTAKIWLATVAGGAVATFEHLPLSSWGEVQVYDGAWLDASAQLLATGASDGVARIWDARQAPVAASRFAPHSAALLRLARGADESQVLAASECGSLLLLDRRRLDAPVMTANVSADSPLCALCMSDPSSMDATAAVAVGAEDGRVAVLDPATLQELTRVKPHEARVGSLAWLRSPTSAQPGEVLSGGWDHRLVRSEVNVMAPCGGP